MCHLDEQPDDVVLDPAVDGHDFDRVAFPIHLDFLIKKIKIKQTVSGEEKR